ncbi:hypothetical protein TNIN_303011 [Trichonephila inaurata madagascariensis]|uniref:Flavin-containing monooxygenase n=1 Tax=Trichonephila inaurata madagascariensis TaxID=2747483 RepID=A0A8X6YMB5_9ARAC|nr:hypothetical protein TNIN_303011 [Trichonephila inaurata madagascariensis]
MSVYKRVAIIGAGPAGLQAIKNLKEEGLEPVCFERTGHLEGLWRCICVAAWILLRVGPNGLPLDVVYLKRWVHLLADYHHTTSFCYVTEKRISERLDQSKTEAGGMEPAPSGGDVLPIAAEPRFGAPKNISKKGGRV